MNASRKNKSSSSCACLVLLFSLTVTGTGQESLFAGGTDPVLPGTLPLTIQKPLDEVMVDGINLHCLKSLKQARLNRLTGKPLGAEGRPPASSATAADPHLVEQRQRFAAITGVTDTRLTAIAPHQYRFEYVASLDEPSLLATSGSGNVAVHAIRWQVLEGVTGEGLLLLPKNVSACLIALPDADCTPEMLCGLDDRPEVSGFRSMLQQLAESGCLIVIPALISRSDQFSGHPQVTWTNQTHREFLYRQAFEMGRHVIGYEVQKVLAAADLLEQLSQRGQKAQGSTALPVAVAGIGEGGLLALYSAALDTRITASLICGYFDEREKIWQEPVYRNVWGLLTEFGDAELARLISPRRLIIEACRVPEVSGPPQLRDGRRSSAAPGIISSNRLPSVQAEFQRAAEYYRKDEQQLPLSLIVSGDDGLGAAGSSAAASEFALAMGLNLLPNSKPLPWTTSILRRAKEATNSEHRTDLLTHSVLHDTVAREKRQFDELQTHVQKLVRLSPHVRDALWLQQSGVGDEHNARRDVLRDLVHDELIGRLPGPFLPPNVRSRLVLQNQSYTGYEVAIDIVEDVIASGILLLPKNLSNAEKRPLIVCQHGLEGTAMETISREPHAFGYYKAFSEELVKQGFIVYAPQNPYRGGDRFRSIQRKANPLRRSLFSYIIAQHEQTLKWLVTLPNVDPKRIAFYGLSYGGKTAMRVPPLADRYCLSICSGDFTDWARTIATNEERYGYAFTTEYEIPEWNLGHLASYAELAMLMTPRPFMVEQGYKDGGAPPEWVASEFEKVRRHYRNLKLDDRIAIEFFDGPHTINGQATFKFLQHHLNWPYSN